MQRILRASFLAFCTVLLWTGLAAALDVPPNTGGFVTDLARLLPAGEKNAIGAELRRYSRATGNQIVVLTVPSLEGEDLAGYANRVARAWGVGRKDRNNGVLILVAAAEKRVRFEVGRGVEDRLPDITAKRIEREITVPAFRAGRYGAGLAGSIRAIEAALGGGGAAQPQRPEPQASGIPWFTLGLIVLAVVVMLVFAGRGRRRLPAGPADGAAEPDDPSFASGFSGGCGSGRFRRPYGRTGGDGRAFSLGVLLAFLASLFRGGGRGGGGFGGGGFGGGGFGDGGGDDGGFSGGGGDFGGGGADSGWGGDN